MFFKRKLNEIRTVNVADLYLCTLGVVSETEKVYEIDSDKLNKPYAILKLREEGIYQIGISPIYSGLKYYNFNNGPIDCSIGQVMMFEIIPLIQLDSIDREYYTIKELKYLEEQLNRQDEELDVLNDAVMQEIKKLSNLAAGIFEENKRQEILCRLNSLGVFYVNELINMRRSKNRELTLMDPEIALINECLKQALEIEREINEEIVNSSLQRDLIVLERSIRGN